MWNWLTNQVTKKFMSFLVGGCSLTEMQYCEINFGKKHEKNPLHLSEGRFNHKEKEKFTRSKKGDI